MGKVAPEGGEQVTIAPGQLSETIGLKVTIEVRALWAFVTVISGGHWMPGLWASITVIVKVHWPVLPSESVAVQTTWLEPSGKNEPETGTQTIFVTVAQMPAPVGAEKLTTAPH